MSEKKREKESACVCVRERESERERASGSVIEAGQGCSIRSRWPVGPNGNTIVNTIDDELIIRILISELVVISFSVCETTVTQGLLRSPNSATLLDSALFGKNGRRERE